MCLGNFDGVHLAHATLLRQGIVLRDENFPSSLCGVFTFFYPSSDYLRVHKTITGGDSHIDTAAHVFRRKKGHHRHLTTLKEKLLHFAALGIDFVCLCDFNQIRSLSPDNFLHLLYEDIGVRGAVCGFNFRFGAGGVGTSSLLSDYFTARPNSFCSVVPALCKDGEPVSSTRIRKMLLTGDADVATKHMGHPYTLQTAVVKGKQLGRSWGLPTANQYFRPESLIPAHGVYAVLCHTPDGPYPGVANIGSHPTVDEAAPVNCETHIIGYDKDLYGYRLKIEFLFRLREEIKFPSESALRSAIQEDIKNASAYVEAYLKKQP